MCEFFNVAINKCINWCCFYICYLNGYEPNLEYDNWGELAIKQSLVWVYADKGFLLFFLDIQASFADFLILSFNLVIHS